MPDNKRVKVAKLSGFCFGVDRAVREAEHLIAESPANTAIYTLGPLIHNPQMLQHFAENGIKEITPEEIDPLLSACDRTHHITLIIRAHGIEKQFSEKLQAFAEENPFFTLIDCTCPYVKKIHRIVSEHTTPDTLLIVIGSAEHPEVKGIISFANGPIIIFPDSGSILPPDDPEKPVLMVAQTTQNTEEWKKCQKFIQKLYTNPQIFDTICSVTENRQKETATLCKHVDLMLVIGGKNSSNTNKLFQIARTACKNTFLVERLSELPLEQLQPGIRVGIAAGASTPGSIIKEVETIMSENISRMEGENFAELLEQSLKTLHTGETVKGVITSIAANEIFVDLGTKTTGVISSEDLSEDGSINPADVYKVGDEIEAIVTKVSDNDGVATLSRKRIERMNNWKKIVEAYENGEVLEGKIVDVVKGGVIILLHAVRVFIPASQTGLPNTADLSPLRGTEQKVKIIDLDQNRNRAIASIRVIQREERKALKEQFWANIEEGKHYTGTVKSLKNYGAFVDLGGVNGMVHITELAWTHIKHPSEVVKKGDVIDVYVKSFDSETKRISLGYKADEDNPWVLFTNQYKVGDVTSAIIMSLLPFGAFAQIIPGTDGLIHISQIANRRIANPAEVLTVGQTVNVKITDIDYENQRISLSMRALIEDDEPEEVEEVEEAVEEVEEAVEEVEDAAPVEEPATAEEAAPAEGAELTEAVEQASKEPAENAGEQE